MSHYDIDLDIQETQQVRVTRSVRIRHLDLVFTSDEQRHVMPCEKTDHSYTIPYTIPNVNEEEQYCPPKGRNRVIKTLHANDESSR